MRGSIDADTGASRVDAEVDRSRDTYIAGIADLLRVAALGEAAVQEHVAASLADLGCRVERLCHRPAPAGPDGEFVALGAGEARDSVVGIWPGSAAARSLGLFAHADVEARAAATRTVEARFCDGRLYGWGVADDLAGVATMVGALRAMREAGSPPTGTVHVASTVSKRGARGIAAVLDAGYRADAALYLHPAESGAGLADVKIATPGLMRFEITIPGGVPPTREPAHTPVRHLGFDPVDGALRVIESLRALDRRRRNTVRHAAMESAAGRATNLHIAHLRAGEPGVLHRIAPDCVLAGSISFPPGEPIASVQAQVQAAVDETARGDPGCGPHPPRVRWLDATPAAEVAPDHPLVTATIRAIAAVTGAAPHPNVLHASSDIRHPLVRGIPCVGFGSLAGGLAHAQEPEEWIDIDDYIRAVKVTARVIGDWCGYGA